MKKLIILKAVLFILAGSILVLPPHDAAAQQKGWKNAAIKYKDSKDKGMLTAEYKVEPQRGKRCRMTIRLTNKTGRTIAHYWFKFTFTDGRTHENNITDHLPGESQELTYGSCAVKSIEISEVE